MFTPSEYPAYYIRKMNRAAFMDCRESILSEGYRDLILDYSYPFSFSPSSERGLCHIDLDGLYRLVYVDGAGLPPVMDSPVEYYHTPKLYGLLPITGGTGDNLFDPGSLAAAGILQVQRPPLQLTGRNVIIVNIGSGIDYRSPAFMDGDGKTRILSVWDQTDQSGRPPEGYLFGTEYTGKDIDEALLSQDPYGKVPMRDEIGHGTAMMEAAAGSRLFGGAFTGAAPDVKIAAVKLKPCKRYLRDYYLIGGEVPAYEEQDVMLAVSYADRLAALYGRPVVICLGIGTNMGSHDGTSPLALYLNSVAAKRRRAAVVAGGDEGNAAHHFSGTLQKDSSPSQVRELDNYRDVEVSVGAGSRGFVLEFWGNMPDVYNIAVRTPGGETVPPQRLGIGESITYSFIYERSRVTVSGILAEAATGEELIVFRIADPLEGVWSFRVSAYGKVYNGEFHMWLPMRQFLDSEVYFLEPDPYTTLTEPSMAAEVIAVSAYNDLNNSFYIESGRGFSRTGRLSPDFAAPGVNVSAYGGKKTGSSLSAAVAAGAVAQFFQWSLVERNGETLENREVKNYLIRGAVRSPGLSYPNREWGYGRLDVEGTFESLAGV